MAQPNCAHCKMRIYKKGCLWYRRETKLLIAQTAHFSAIGYDYDDDGYVVVMMMIMMMMTMMMIMIIKVMMIKVMMMM